MGTIRVLCVAADPATLERTASTLAGEGFAVEAAEDGAAALDALGTVDCLVMEATLPGSNGLELLSRGRERNPSLVVVPVTGAEGAGSLADRIRRVVGERRANGSNAAGGEGSDASGGEGSDEMMQGANYRGLVETMADAVYTVDLDGRFVMMNERTAALTGHDREALIGAHVSTVMSDADIEVGEAVIRDLLRRDEPATATFEMELVRKDGTTIPCEDHVALLTDGERATGTIGVVRDLSVVRERDERLRQLHDATRELVSATDAEAIAAITVSAMADILGYPINCVRLVDETGSFLLPTAITERTIETLGERPVYLVDGDGYPSEVFRSGESFGIDDVVTVPGNHDWGPLRSTYYLPLGEYGVISIGATEPAAFDESDRQLADLLAATAESALVRADQRAALAKERDQLAALFENVPDPTVMVEYRDDEPIVQDVNSAFTRVFGFEKDWVLGESVDDFIVPVDAESESEQYNDQIQAGESFHGEVRRLTSNGPRDFLLHVAPQTVGQRTARGFAIYTDITDQKERERELQRQNERLEQFASVVSHDLRNPLNILQGQLELAQETGEADHFESAQRAADRMEELVSGLLTLAQQGRTVGKRESVPLDTVTHEACESVEGPDATLELDAPPVVHADRSRLRQLMENLLRNAVEHAGEDVTVTVGALDDGFYVADDGPGIPGALCEQVFEFGRSGRDGTGFGLAIVKQIAEAHGWTVSIGDGPGTRFEFRGVELD